MNKIILQLWEESERGFGIRPDGCSVHINSLERKRYIDSIYSNRSSEVPDEYEHIIGDEIVAFIEDGLFEHVISEGSIRIEQYQFNNLIKLGDLIINSDI